MHFILEAPYGDLDSEKSRLPRAEETDLSDVINEESSGQMSFLLRKGYVYGRNDLGGGNSRSYRYLGRKRAPVEMSITCLYNWSYARRVLSRKQNISENDLGPKVTKIPKRCRYRDSL